jgi:hypothetical protein
MGEIGRILELTIEIETMRHNGRRREKSGVKKARKAE